MSETEQSQNVAKAGASEASGASGASSRFSAAAKAAEEGKRVYVGNIPFKSNYAQIKELFEGFEVVAVTIPKTRSTSKAGKVFFRRLGYAFVELPSKEEAERAVKELQGKSLEERDLSIKLAKAIEKKPKTNGGNATDSNNNESTNSTGGTKKKQPKAKRPEGQETSDSVYVSNLAPDTKKEELEEFFKGLNISEIKVTTKNARKISRKGKVVTIPRRSFAIIKFEQEADQKKAIEQFDSKTLNEQEINVKVAKDMSKSDDDDAEDNGDDQDNSSKQDKNAATTAAESDSNGKAENE